MESITINKIQLDKVLEDYEGLLLGGEHKKAGCLMQIQNLKFIYHIE